MTAAIERNTLLRPRIQRHRRLMHTLEIEVRGEVVAERARSHDISAGGMFVDSAQDYLTGMVLRLRFTLGEREFETRARVVHVRPQMGFGAQFLDLDAEQRNYILRFVHQQRATREAERLMRNNRWEAQRRR